jgi:hypothetical protein
MPFGGFINQLPPAFFLLVHLVAFLVGAFFAYRAMNANARTLGRGFALYAVAELIYMTYHLDWTVFLFAHTIAEVLDLIGFVLIFVGAGALLTQRSTTSAAQTSPTRA